MKLKGRLTIVLIFSLRLAFPSFGFSRQKENVRAQATGDIKVEFGIDSGQRKYYRPQFNLAWPLDSGANTRLVFDLSYYERMNSRLQGAIDYWLAFGLERDLASGLKFEARLNHFCRHLTSLENPYILNLNEIFGRLWLTSPNVQAAFGAGTYAGGSPGFDSLAVFNLNVQGFPSDEVSLESEWKWVNFQDILYEAGLFVSLAKGVDLFFRTAKHYRFPPTSYLGFRFRSEGTNERYLDRFMISTGVYPFYGMHKLTAEGGYRIEFFKSDQRRFMLDVGFQSPILDGDSFFSQFWPDRMLYDVTGEYERTLSPSLRIAWYARTFIDMPADKNQEFRSSLESGLTVRNQPDFDRLDSRLRFEIAAGANFRRGYDLGLKLGINTLRSAAANLGSDFRCRLDGERQMVEWKVFADFGRGIPFRPFIGLRKTSGTNAEPDGRVPFERMLLAGISFYKWFD